MTARELYAKVYALKNPVHPRKGKLHPYGSETKRDKHILRAISKFLGEPPAKILDASCGRGHLMRALINMGYEVEGSEIVALPDLDGLHVYNLTYEELDQLPEKSYDAVISSDVLEHLEERETEPAIQNLCRLSSGWMFLSVGIFPAVNFPEACRALGVDDMHKTVQRQGWWLNRFSQFICVEETFRTNRSFFAYGRVL